MKVQEELETLKGELEMARSQLQEEKEKNAKLVEPRQLLQQGYHPKGPDRVEETRPTAGTVGDDPAAAQEVGQVSVHNSVADAEKDFRSLRTKTCAITKVMMALRWDSDLRLIRFFFLFRVVAG